MASPDTHHAPSASPHESIAGASAGSIATTTPVATSVSNEIPTNRSPARAKRARPVSADENTTPNRPRTVRRRAPVTTAMPAPVLIPEEIRCQYKGKLCRNERTYKEDGERHSLCELHRQRANANQRRWQKKHQHKVRRRRAAAAQALAEALPYARASTSSSSAAQDLLTHHDEDEDDAEDWIDPLFDHLIAKLEAETAATQSGHHRDRPT